MGRVCPRTGSLRFAAAQQGCRSMPAPGRHPVGWAAPSTAATLVASWCVWAMDRCDRFRTASTRSRTTRSAAAPAAKSTSIIRARPARSASKVQKGNRSRDRLYFQQSDAVGRGRRGFAMRPDERQRQHPLWLLRSACVHCRASQSIRPDLQYQWVQSKNEYP